MTNIQQFDVPFKYKLYSVDREDVQELFLHVIATATVAPFINDITQQEEKAITIHINSISRRGCNVRDIVLFNPEWKHDIYRAAHIEAQKLLNPPSREKQAILEIRDALYGTCGFEPFELPHTIAVPVGFDLHTHITALRVSPSCILEARYSPEGWQAIEEEDKAAIIVIQAYLADVYGREEEEAA